LDLKRADSNKGAVLAVDNTALEGYKRGREALRKQVMLQGDLIDMSRRLKNIEHLLNKILEKVSN